MLIYERQDDKIKIYEMIGKSEEIKKYRKGVISRHKNEGLIYSLKTNCYRVKETFNTCTEVPLPSLEFYTTHGSYFGTEYSKIELNDFNKDIIEKYLSGLYDNLEPFSVCKYTELEKKIIHRFIKTCGMEEKNINCRRIWEFNNLIDLPRELYILQLLLLGKFKELENENIRKQLSLFEVNHLKSVKLLEIKEMLETGLVSGSLESIDNMASVGRKILSKRK